ncbi:MAG: NADH-quinone oxidoreductase subunit D [Thermoplasmata archaeon]|nr:NADH-quinone oxidoreductase subunit D [Thermoplasmata archaeon]
MAEMWINMGPQHPMTHGLWNLRVKVDGEVIVDAMPEIGYLHRGMEKIFENKTYTQIGPITDRLCYGSSFTWNHLYCMTVENLMDLEIPERAKYIRVAAIEIQRIASHLMWIAAFAADLGLLTGFLWAMRDREIFIDLLQALSGSRLTYNYARIGGVTADFPPDFERDCIRAVDYFEKKMPEHESLYDSSKIFHMRTRGIGVLSREDAINLGVTGPTLRASNAKLDVRKDRPYEVYDEIDFEVQCHTDCDCWGRYRVRMNEMRESCKIIRQAIAKMPKGPVRVKTPLIGPARDAIGVVEDPRGEGIMYVIGDGTDRPYRLKVRSPLFVILSAAKPMLLGYKVADVVAIMGSIDVCMGETDK